MRAASKHRSNMSFSLLSAMTSAVFAMSALAPTHVSASTQQEVTETDGTRTLIVSVTNDLDPDAQTLRVRGTGYDTTKGIYVGLCAVQSPDQQPSPCGGGIDKSGSSGSSAWISSNPPAYGVGLAVPYSDGGSFDVEIAVSAAVNDVVDCRRVECAIVTKNDHTIISDRSQDIIIPVTFTGEAPPLPSSTTAAPSDDTVTELTVSPGVEDLTGVATSNDSGLGWAPIVIGLGVLATLSSIIIVSVRRTSARRGR
jgi:hypothetical protein